MISNHVVSCCILALHKAIQMISVNLDTHHMEIMRYHKYDLRNKDKYRYYMRYIVDLSKISSTYPWKILLTLLANSWNCLGISKSNSGFFSGEVWGPTFPGCLPWLRSMVKFCSNSISVVKFLKVWSCGKGIFRILPGSLTVRHWK